MAAPEAKSAISDCILFDYCDTLYDTQDSAARTCITAKMETEMFVECCFGTK